MLGTILTFGLTLSSAHTQRSLPGLLIAASAGFHLGLHHQQHAPLIAEPIYYLIGNILALSLIFACALAMGMAFQSEPDAPPKDEEAKPFSL